MVLSDAEEICFEHGITLFEFEALVAKAIADKYGFYGTACYLSGYVIGYKQVLNDGKGAVYQRKSIKLTQKNRNELKSLVAKVLEDYIPFSHIQRICGFFAENLGCVQGIISKIENSELRIDFLDSELRSYSGKMPLDDKFVLSRDLKAGKYRVGQVLYFAIAESKLTIEQGRFNILLKRADTNIIKLHLRKALAFLEKRSVKISATVLSVSFKKNLTILKVHSEISPEVKGFLSQSLGMTIKYIV